LARSSPPLSFLERFYPDEINGFFPAETNGRFASRARATLRAMPSDAGLADWFALLAVCVTAAAAAAAAAEAAAAEAAAAAASPICVRSRVATPEGRPVYNAESTAN